MHHAFGVMHLAPNQFWAMTPREFASSLPQQIARSMDRSDLEKLMHSYPDEGQSDG